MDNIVCKADRQILLLFFYFFFFYLSITNYFWIASPFFNKLITLLIQNNRSKTLNKVNTLFKVPIKGLI